MSGNRNVLPEEKLNAVKEYLGGSGSSYTIARKYNVNRKSFCQWVAKYKAFGDSAFIRTGNNATYTIEFKNMVVNAYLNGEASPEELSAKYKIPSKETVRQWILKYTSHEELKAYRTGGTLIMTKGRTTTYDERVEVVRYCIEHGMNYAATAQKYQVSYQQVHSWVKKYETKGVEALVDRRGKTKSEDEMSELEKLRAKNKLLEAEKRHLELENAFLKKLDEIERRRY
jgi:transposase